MICGARRSCREFTDGRLRTISGHIKAIIELGIIAVIAVTSWILGVRMQGRHQKSLGIDVKREMELTSPKTWMDVERAEEKNQGGKMH